MNVAVSFQVILKSIFWFFCVCKNYVDTSCFSSSSIHSSSNSIADSLRQRRWLRAEKIWLSLLFTLVSISKVLIPFALCSVLLTHRGHQKMSRPKLRDWNCMKDWFFNQVGRNWYRYRNVLAIPSFCIGVAEFVFLHKNWFKHDYCHVLTELLVYGEGDGKLVYFVK